MQPEIIPFVKSIQTSLKAEGIKSYISKTGNVIELFPGGKDQSEDFKIVLVVTSVTKSKYPVFQFGILTTILNGKKSEVKYTIGNQIKDITKKLISEYNKGLVFLQEISKEDAKQQIQDYKDKTDLEDRKKELEKNNDLITEDGEATTTVSSGLGDAGITMGTGEFGAVPLTFGSLLNRYGIKRKKKKNKFLK